MPDLWTKQERIAWCWPKEQTPTQWAEAHRILKAGSSAEPGRYKASRTPYARGMADAILEPGVEEIVIVAGTQVGKTTIEETLLGYWIDNDPAPTLVVKPSEQACRDYVQERIRPMLDASPALKRHLLEDGNRSTLGKIELDSMTIFFGWAGSPQSLASRPCGRVLLDEVDKFPPFSGREADPVSLAKERTATYGHRRRIVLTSTPTTTDGPIWVAYQACGQKRHYHVPCPHCGRHQVLRWDQIKWVHLPITDKIALADTIEQNRLAWYECESCKGRIDDSHKPRMLEHGRWLHEGQSVNADGKVEGDAPKTKRIGFHLPSWYSPWKKWAEIAAEFIRADGDVGAMMNFRNSRAAEPFEIQLTKRDASKVRDKEAEAIKRGPAGMARVVPDWAAVLLATVDVQKDHAYYSVTAWGYGLKSKRLQVGVAPELSDIYDAVFKPPVPFATAGGKAVAVTTMIVDSGYRKDEVTNFAKTDPTRIHMAKGMSTYFGPIAQQKVEKASGVLVWNINTMQSKDTLDRLVGHTDPEIWQTYAGIGDEFARQMTAEHKVLDPQTKKAEWKPKTSGADNHWWDCEAMAAAVATSMGAAAVEPEPPPVQRPVEKPASTWAPDRPSASEWMR